MWFSFEIEPMEDNSIAFIDESGDHNLSIQKLDNLYNVFVLCAVLFHEESAYFEFDKTLKKLKQEYFGSADLILHTREMNRPDYSTNVLYQKFKKNDFRSSFYDAINNLIDQTDFSVIATVINKIQLVEKYGEFAQDPYLLSFDSVLNRILFDSKDKVKIYPESRCNSENNKLEIAFLHTKVTGTRFIKGAEISKRVIDFKLLQKSTNSSGLQLADLVATPIGRHILGKFPKPKNEVSYSTIKQKIRRQGLIILPK